jgi:glycine betaine/proline transport system ATP-binding protein
LIKEKRDGNCEKGRQEGAGEEIRREEVPGQEGGEEVAGLVTYQQAAAAERDSDSGLNDVSLASVMMTDFPTTDADTQLADLYRQASSGLPIAITDADNRLVGVVEPEAVFAQLSTDAPTPDAAEPEAVRPQAAQ